MTGWRSLLFPSLTDIFFLVVLATALMLGAQMISWNGDTPRHLTVGEYMLDTRGILRADVFSYTKPGAPYVAKEWLAEVVTAVSHRIAGTAGLVLMHAAVIGIAYGLVLGHLLRSGYQLWVAATVTALTMAAGAFHWVARPLVFTFLGTAIFIVVLDGWYRGQLSRRWLWVLPLSMAFWANLHGAFLIGLLVGGVYFGSDLLRWLGSSRNGGSQAATRLKTLIPFGLATLVATQLNPAGPVLLEYLAGFFQKSVILNRTAEWRSPDFHLAEMWPFLLFLAVLLTSLAWSQRRLALHEGLLLTAFGGLALYANRNAPLLAIVAAPVLAAQLAGLRLGINGALSRVSPFLERLKERDARLTAFNASLHGHLWPAAVLLGMCLLARSQTAAGTPPLDVSWDPVLQPVHAVQHLKQEQPLGRGFSDIDWGGYLIRELWPTDQVFIDGQTDFYGEELANEYIRVRNLGEGWQDALDAHAIRWVLFRTDSPLARELALRPGWRVDYQDPTATVLMRQ